MRQYFYTIIVFGIVLFLSCGKTQPHDIAPHPQPEQQEPDLPSPDHPPVDVKEEVLPEGCFFYIEEGFFYIDCEEGHVKLKLKK